MKYYIIGGLALLLALTSCTKYDEIHTGIYHGDHDCSMWEYFHLTTGNWDSLVVAVEYAGLKDVFDGTNPGYKDGITFFGITNASIRHTILNTLDDNWERKYRKITDIPVEECRKMILSHVIRGRKMMADFDYEVKGTLGGGNIVRTLTGTDLRVYRFFAFEGTNPEVGWDGLGIHALENGVVTTVESCNICTVNGVVHALANSYEWTEL